MCAASLSAAGAVLPLTRYSLLEDDAMRLSTVALAAARPQNSCTERFQRAAEHAIRSCARQLPLIALPGVFPLSTLYLSFQLRILRQKRWAFWPACLALAVLLLAIPPAYGTEENFVYLDRMPKVQGELESIHSRKDPISGLIFVKKIYRARIVHDDFLIHVLEVYCANEKKAIELPGPYIVAFQSLPKNPKGYSIMERHASFGEVCVRDLQSKIRLYRNMHARHMVELTHRFLPFCPAI